MLGRGRLLDPQRARAGVVIGAGSTSFEVIRQLASLLLVQPVPVVDAQLGAAGRGQRRACARWWRRSRTALPRATSTSAAPT